MPSTFTWVDYEEKDRQKMMEVIKMFQESDTRDELGIGTIRDTIAEMFFPGTTTIQTKVKYMLFIPWIYLRHEKKKTPSSEMNQKIRNDEIALIKALLQSGETIGVIGGEAKESLKRMPSSVYWYGLGRWGIRQFSGSMDELHRFMDHYYEAKKNAIKDDDHQPVSGTVRDNWHPGLPPVPDEFPSGANFQLTQTEAEYLADRIMHSCKDTLFAYLVSAGREAMVSFIWEHPDFGSFPEKYQKQIIHARNFAVAMNGAALLYNLMLAEKSENEKRITEYTGKLEAWADRMGTINFGNWDLKEFWEIVNPDSRIPFRTQRFVSEWLNIGCGPDDRHNVQSKEAARLLIINRERELKRNRARLENQRALEMWTGAAGTGQLSYRWQIARGMINDIIDGLQGDRDAKPE